jgi:transposase-like protein
VRSLASAVLAPLPRSGRSDGRTELQRGPLHHCWLGLALCSASAIAHGAPSSSPNRSWRVDETYVRVAGRWTYSYRALDSEGNTIDFMLSLYRDRLAAKHFLQLALWRAGHLGPRVFNVDGHPAYPSVIVELKKTGELQKACQYRRSLIKTT